MEPKDIKLIDFSRQTKELFKVLLKIKQYKGSIKQQVRQFMKDLEWI